jgi:hypothetical protein
MQDGPVSRSLLDARYREFVSISGCRRLLATAAKSIHHFPEIKLKESS